jgi:hypothetical protein
VTTKVMVRERIASTEKDPHAWMKNQARGRRDGGGKVKKPQTALWACSAVKGVCTQKPHPRIGCAVHGSKEEAERCNRRAEKLAQEALETNA